MTDVYVSYARGCASRRLDRQFDPLVQPLGNRALVRFDERAVRRVVQQVGEGILRLTFRAVKRRVLLHSLPLACD